MGGRREVGGRGKVRMGQSDQANDIRGGAGVQSRYAQLNMDENLRGLVGSDVLGLYGVLMTIDSSDIPTSVSTVQEKEKKKTEVEAQV